MIHLYFKASDWYHNNDTGYMLTVINNGINGIMYFSSYEKMMIYSDINGYIVKPGICKKNLKLSDI